MQNKDLTLGLIDNIVDRIIDIKYENDRVFNVDVFRRICDQLRQMEESMVIDMSMSVRLPNENMLEKYSTLDWFKNNKKQFIQTSIYDRLDKITEIKYCYGLEKGIWNSDLLATVKLKKGYIHCEDGPAFIFNNSEIYYLYNDIIDYDNWVKHPMIRESKIKKIRQRYGITTL